ncbi:hypothetical protein HMPREF0043_01243 [Actinobaculum sp. oral taxon 183 str. F0552]|nr:hypothetical protein HMPREF0043_01243 [Actinobaculum sp. oral taxon 183 str. F0552]
MRSGEWLRDGESECVQWRRRLPPGINLHTGGFDIRDAIACRARFLRGNRSVPGSPACLDDLGRARRGSGSAR